MLYELEKALNDVLIQIEEDGFGYRTMDSAIRLRKILDSVLLEHADLSLLQEHFNIRLEPKIRITEAP